MPRPVCITYDSTCDLTPQLLERFHIRTIPLTIQSGGRVFPDDGNYTSAELYTSPAAIVGGMWYCWLLAAFGLLSIFVPYADGVCRKDPWNWEYGCAQSGVEEKKALLAQEREDAERL